jgi:uncharacterized membrane protein YgdD (TMEM256/DUF423 family)
VINKNFSAAAGLAGLAVILGAFGAHALKGMGVSAAALETWKTGVQYHMFHAGALLLSSSVDKEGRFGLVRKFWWGGVIVFSGSLYLLALTNTKILGALAPVGGLSMILGWLLLSYKTWTGK